MCVRVFLYLNEVPMNNQYPEVAFATYASRKKLTFQRHRMNYS